MKTIDPTTSELMNVYRQMTEKVDRSDVKRLATKSETEIVNVDVKDFVRNLSTDISTVKKNFIKAAQLPENTPELEMFVVSYNNLLKVLSEKGKIKDKE